jgi:hypothetical protein
MRGLNRNALAFMMTRAVAPRPEPGTPAFGAR